MAASFKTHLHGATVTQLLEKGRLDYVAPDRRDVRSRDQLLGRVRAEFEEMPGLRLTLAQAVRLFDLREDVCTRVLDRLVDQRALARGLDGQYGCAAEP
jgi:hypothetical protein